MMYSTTEQGALWHQMISATPTATGPVPLAPIHPSCPPCWVSTYAGAITSPTAIWSGALRPLLGRQSPWHKFLQCRDVNVQSFLEQEGAESDSNRELPAIFLLDNTSQRGGVKS